MKTSISSIALAVIGVTSLAFAMTMSVARAQDFGGQAKTADPAQNFGGQAKTADPAQNFGGQAQPGFPPQNGFGNPGQAFPGQAPQPQMRGGGMGGQVTMVADGDSLYILQGGHLLKVAKGDLRVVREAMLPIGMPGQNPFGGTPQGGGFGEPGSAGPRRGGGIGGGQSGGGKQAK